VLEALFGLKYILWDMKEENRRQMFDNDNEWW